MLCGFIFAVAVSIGFQSLVVWTGNLLPGEYGLGIDALIGVLMVMPIFMGALISDDFSTFTVGMVIAMLAVVGIYVSVTLYFNWFLFVGAMALFIVTLIKMDRDCTKKFWLYAVWGGYLCYCVGAYYAQVLNGIEPVMDVTAINILTALMVIVWSKPFFSYIGECMRKLSF